MYTTVTPVFHSRINSVAVARKPFWLSGPGQPIVAVPPHYAIPPVKGGVHTTHQFFKSGPLGRTRTFYSRPRTPLPIPLASRGKGMAERAGFEPAIGWKTRCLLSRKVLSTTQPTFHKVAGLVRFELTVGLPTSVFKTGALNRSATNPDLGVIVQTAWHLHPRY